MFELPMGNLDKSDLVSGTYVIKGLDPNIRDSNETNRPVQLKLGSFVLFCHKNFTENYPRRSFKFSHPGISNTVKAE